MTVFAWIWVILEVLLAGAVCLTMSRVAEADNRSPLLWAVITAIICVASVVIPYPGLRLVAAGYAVAALMYVANLIRLPQL